MKRDIATGKFTLFCAKWTMTSKRCAFEICREIQNASAVLGIASTSGGGKYH
jgi:hypothetical protein